MDIKVDENSVIVFDLDDTLYKEMNYVKSAYRYIAKAIEEECGINYFTLLWQGFQNGESAFDLLVERYSNWSTQKLVETYRYHSPTIELETGTKEFLYKLKAKKAVLGVITDGRSRTQRAKLRALGINDLLSHIVISEELGSEKPCEANFSVFEELFPKRRYFYIGDNISKDFVTPNKLGWETIGVRDDGRNIHPQSVEVPNEFLPSNFVQALSCIKVV